MGAPAVHFTFNVRAREGTYFLRVYSVVEPLAAAALGGSLMNRHWNQLVAPVELPGDVVQEFQPFSVETESELEQGQPRIGQVTLDLQPIKELAPLIAAARDVAQNIWIEILLTQHILDAPVRPDAAGLVWPNKTRLVYWGMLDRKTLKGKVHAQHRIATKQVFDNEVIRATKAHTGELSMDFIHWSKCIPASVTTALNTIGSGTTVCIANLFAGLLTAMAPTTAVYIGDQRLQQQLLTTLVPPDESKWGSLNFVLSSDSGTTTHKNIAELYVNGTGSGQHPLFINDPAGSNELSFYRWKDFPTALSELCREFFLTWQVELPPLELGQKVNFAIESAMRVLLMPDDAMPLALYADPHEETIEYDPCGAWASSYKIDEPAPDDLSPSYATATSKLFGGTDQSYKTLLRLIGVSAGVPDMRGFGILCKDHTGTIAPANWVTDLSITPMTDWASFHAWRKINRWGNIRAIVTFTARGVGLEPFGASAAIDGKKIIAPVKTFGFNDFAEFPLQRFIPMLPGIFYDIHDADLESAGTVQAPVFAVIQMKRTPNGDMEVKAVEFSGEQFFTTDIISLSPAPPVPPPPAGPPDRPMVAITPLAGPLAGRQTITVTATNTYGVAQVTVTVDGAILDTQVASRTSGVWTFAFDTTKYSGTVASPQPHTVLATAYDLGGNTTATPLIVTVAN